MRINKNIEGRVQDKSIQENLIAFKIETPLGDTRLIAGKETTNPSLYHRLKTIQTGDFCSFEVIPEENEPVISKLLAHIEKQGDYSWTQRQSKIVKAYSFILNTIRKYLDLNGYTEVRLPMIHYGENKQETFAVDFYGKTARLTSSNSLFLDIYTVQLQKAYSLQRCFRAEKSWPFRHLAEFDMLEVARINSTLEDAMTEVEKLIKFVLNKFGKSPLAALSPVNFNAVHERKFPVLDYREIEQQYRLDGESAGEYEVEIARQGPVFITNLPRKISSWTAQLVDNKYTRTFNLLLPGVGEGVEGSQKQTDMEAFAQKIKNVGMEAQLGWYVKMMPYSKFLLASFGLGIERLIMWLMGLKDIREVHPIYRDNDFSELKEYHEKNKI